MYVHCDATNPLPALRVALGDTREESSALTAKRLRHKRALEEERRARGLTVDDAVLEAMMDAQEGPQHSKKKVGGCKKLRLYAHAFIFD